MPVPPDVRTDAPDQRVLMRDPMYVLLDHRSPWLPLQLQDLLQELRLRHQEILPVRIPQDLKVLQHVHYVSGVDGSPIGQLLDGDLLILHFE